MDENSNEKVYDAEPIKASETKQEATYTVSSESNDTASQGEYQNTTAKESSDPFNVASSWSKIPCSYNKTQTCVPVILPSFTKY